MLSLPLVGSGRRKTQHITQPSSAGLSPLPWKGSGRGHGLHPQEMCSPGQGTEFSPDSEFSHTHTRKPQGPVMGTEVSVGSEGGAASGRRVSALGISTLTWLSHVCGPGEEALRISRPRVYVVKAETCGCFISPQISVMTQLANSPP